MRKIKIVDIVIIVAVLAALLVGFLTYKNFRQTADKQVEKNSKIAFQVFMRGVTITGGASPIRIGDDTFISIRNVPYTDLKVVDVKSDTKKIVVPNPRGKQAFTLVDDYSQIFMYDIIVTVIDSAKITKDGAVVGGNKIKIGLPITLEGKDYKFNGTVSNVVELTDDQANQIEAAAAQVVAKQAEQVKQMQQQQQQQQAAMQSQQPQTVAVDAQKK